MKPLVLGAAAILISVATLVVPQVLAQKGSVQTPQPVGSREGGRADVERVQEGLKRVGHDPGPIDGIMGPQTGAALRAYQEEQRLRPTGRLDEATLTKLRLRSTSDQQTGGDRETSAVDPAEAKKSGANVGEGASYNRSTEKGKSARDRADQTK